MFALMSVSFREGFRPLFLLLPVDPPCTNMPIHLPHSKLKKQPGNMMWWTTSLLPILDSTQTTSTTISHVTSRFRRFFFAEPYLKGE